MDEQHDLIIIGAGPAGISASIYAVRKNLKVLLVSKNIGGQAAFSGNVENLVGYSLITGAELATKFREEIERFNSQGLTIKEGEEVTNLSGQDGDFEVQTNAGKYRSKTVIIATGRIPKMLNIPGEKEFLGKGVATCATCDAPLFRGKDVAVVGGGNSAMDAAASLFKVADKVYIVNINPALYGDEFLRKEVENAPNVVQFSNYAATQVFGDKVVTGLEIENQKTKEKQTLPVLGVFVEVG